MHKLFILDMDLKIANLRIQPHLPGANEFSTVEVDKDNENDILTL